MYSYASEVSVYEKLHDLKPEGYEFCPSMLAYGKIFCSSKFPSGYIAILSKVNGEPFSCYLNPPLEPFAEEKLDLPIEEQLHIYTQCRKAISVLRSISLCLPGAGTQNVLYDKESKDLTVLDFEKPGAVDSEEELRRLDDIELELIFGRETGAELKGLYDGQSQGEISDPVSML